MWRYFLVTTLCSVLWDLIGDMNGPQYTLDFHSTKLFKGLVAFRLRSLIIEIWVKNSEGMQK